MVRYRRLKGRRPPRPPFFLIHFIDLLERQPLGLVDEPPGEEGTDQTECPPNKEHLGTEIRVAGPRVDHVGGRVRNRPVEQPVGRRRHRKAFGPCLQRKHLARHHPRQWSPRRRKEKDVDAHKRNQDFVGRHARAGRGTGNGDNILTDKHADRAPEEHRTPSPFFNHIQARQGGDDIHDVGNDAGDEGVVDPRRLEERGTVVEDAEATVSGQSD